MAARMVVGVAVALLAVLLAAATTGADGRDFHVGGRAGWAPNPAEPFNTWAERNRFQVNDTLVFRYNKDADAVLVVTPSHYDACNTTEPVLRLGGGDSRFVFNASGPYFFISADEGRCRAGERLIVVVLAVRNNGGGNSSPPTSPPPAAAPAPHALPPPPPAGKNASSSPAPATAPAATNVTSSPPSPSSAGALKGGVLACLIVGGAAILV
ncbi:early nodulin-like protein 1 [Panicum virgatum]|uniref:early nodulin-like protein 1 n=1 Tax=Panicum virgatum TaxID=38727 RepID=UPI0019D659BD|nr:early nodulin-like protein 1 [Panicum virgatum]